MNYCVALDDYYCYVDDNKHGSQIGWMEEGVRGLFQFMIHQVKSVCSALRSLRTYVSLGERGAVRLVERRLGRVH